VVGTGIKNHNYDRRPLEPLSDGRPSRYTQRLLEDARRAFLASNEPMFSVATDAGKLMSKIERVMEEYNVTEEVARQYALMTDNRQRKRFKEKHQQHN
jgi:hypothetical protein